jgi:hypothetical protein
MWNYILNIAESKCEGLPTKAALFAKASVLHFDAQSRLVQAKSRKPADTCLSAPTGETVFLNGAQAHGLFVQSKFTDFIKE